ncbi:hypothetical protein AB0O47_20075 [Streptomyces noursei]|uniref:hypothetical protein n=1 Tax=Streptomyces noursei TaxID=1971 RepID=UPI00344CF73C
MSRSGGGLGELAADKPLKTSSAVVQEQGRQWYVQSRMRTSATSAVVGDVEEPSCVVEVLAPREEFVLEYPALVASPAAGWLAVAVWRGKRSVARSATRRSRWR